MTAPGATTISKSLSPLPEETREQFRSTFLNVAPAMFLATLDQTIIAAALPAIAGSLGRLSYLSWVVTVYLLSATVAAPLFGRMGDAFGRKLMLVWSLGVFVAGSIACAAAPNLAALICARAVQGFGGGGLMTLAQALLGEVVSPRERGRFQGWFGALFALASTVGPMIGGFLSQYLGWRSIFWVNIPLGVVATATALRVKTFSGTGVCRLDYAGATLFVGSTSALLLALSLGGHEFPWTSPILLAIAILGLSGFLLFFKVEQKSADPLISPQLMEEPVIWRASLTVLLFAAVLFGLVIELPLFFQTSLHVSPTMSGLMLIPLALAEVAVSTFTGLRISTTGHPRTAMASSLSIVAAGFVVLSSEMSLGPVFICVLTFLIGAGLGSTMPAAQTMVQWAAGERRLGVGTALVSFGRTMGGVLGASIASAVLLGALQLMDPNAWSALSRELAAIGSGHAESMEVIPALAGAYRWMFIALGMLSACAALVAWSIPDLDLAANPDGNAATADSGGV